MNYCLRILLYQSFFLILLIIYRVSGLSTSPNHHWLLMMTCFLPLEIQLHPTLAMYGIQCILHTHQHHINYKVSVEKVGRTDVYGVGPTPCSEYIRIDLYLYKKNLMERLIQQKN